MRALETSPPNFTDFQAQLRVYTGNERRHDRIAPDSFVSGPLLISGGHELSGSGFSTCGWRI